MREAAICGLFCFNYLSVYFYGMTSNKEGQPVLSSLLRSNYYYSLNGFRGISIILVVFYHLQLSDNYFYTTIFNGGLGVNIFFVISGFLITSLCLKEKEVTGGLSLKKFYIRRFLRIFPLAYLYIGVVFLLNHFYSLNISWIQFFGSALYLMNFSYFRSHDFTYYFSHYWSLSVEEQFYLLFPFILKINRTAFYYIIISIVFALPLLCTVQQFVPVLNRGIIYCFTHYFIKFQSIGVGCFFALMASKEILNVIWLKQTKAAGNILAIILMFGLRFDEFYTLKSLYVNLAISVITGYLILSNIIPANDWIFKVLNNKFLSFIGILSYGIYIWQQLFTGRDSKMLLSIFPNNVLGLITVPLLSYYLYERRFLKLKSKFTHK